MADVRALLRQQQVARRITHPLAHYTEVGKLVCTACNEQVRSETLWDAHIRSASHRQRVQPLNGSHVSTAAGPATSQSHQSTKRKHDDSDDSTSEAEDGVRKKRSRPEISLSADKEKNLLSAPRATTPPSLNRRTSMTPVQGVEIQIPSRPATPATRDTSSSNTPNTATMPSIPTPRESNATPQSQTVSLPAQATTALQRDINEDEWAAFEADIEALSYPTDVDPDATISAPAMTAEESAAAARATGEETTDETPRTKIEVQLADEKEEAKRALENEFEEMEVLEERVRRLREKRDALRQARLEAASTATSQPVVNGDSYVNGDASVKSGAGKENVATIEEEEEDEDEGDEDEDEDEWVGFRFRT